MRGLKRGILGGLLLAVITFFLPDGLLGAITVGTGLSSIVPQTAPPLGTTARLLLGAMALLIGFGLTLWLVRRNRPTWDVDDSTDAEPLPAYEQMGVSSAAYAAPAAAAVSASPAPVTTAVADDRGLERRLSRIEASLAEVPAQIARALTGGTPASDDAALLARIETLETQIGERLAAIEARLSADGDEAGGTPYQPNLRAPKRISPALADIRRTLDGR